MGYGTIAISQPLPPIPPVQCRPSWVTAHAQFCQVTFLWPQNIIPSMHRDHLVGNRYFVPFFVFYTESVMLGTRFLPESAFYTMSVMLSPRFIPRSLCFIPSP